MQYSKGKMSSYKLTYFNFRGNAEICRLVLAAAGQEYQDVRIEMEDWPKMKQDTPFGQLPILEVDGQTVAQSKAISRYLALQFGLGGKTPMEQAQADMIVDCIDDSKMLLYPIYLCKDEDEKVVLQQKLKEETWPKFLGQLESLLKSNNEGKGYFVGDELTWADLQFINMVVWPKSIGVDCDCSSFPLLRSLQERVESLPRIAKWLKERPDTPR